MTENQAKQPPIYIESLQVHRQHKFTATKGDAEHRHPVRLEEIWDDYSLIPDTPNAGLLADGNVAGPVTLRLSKALSLVAGTTKKFEITAAPASLQMVITATHGQVAPITGSVGPVLSGQPATGYTPVLRDARGIIHPMVPAEWVIDGINHYVEFPFGIPSTYIQPLSLSFFEYTGPFGTSSIPHPWERLADPVTAQQIVRLNPAYPTATTDDVVFPALSTEGASTRFFIDTSLPAIRGGRVTGAQWDQASRGIDSVAFGVNNTASGNISTISGGTTNLVSAVQGTIAGGSTNIVSGLNGAVGGGTLNASTANSATVAGGSTNASSGTASSVGGGSTNTASANYSVVSGGFGCTASGLNSTVGGGSGNNASGDYSVIAGGITNTAAAIYSTVCGGNVNNIASGTNGTIVGGNNNTLTLGSSSAIVGGASNSISSSNSFICCGQGCINSGLSTFCGGGVFGIATHNNCFLWSDSTARTTTADNQVTYGAAGGFRVFAGGAAGSLIELDGPVHMPGKLTVDGVIDPTGLVLVEQAAIPQAPLAGEGAIWCRNDAPNTIVFTDDTNTDHTLLYSDGVTLADAGILGGHTSLVNDGTSPSLAVVGLSVAGGISVLPTGITDVTIGTTVGSISSRPWFLRDEKASGTNGGTFTSGAWQTRTLNVLTGNPSNDVTLAANQFTLNAGTYAIRASAPALDVDQNVAKIRNITAGTDALIGTAVQTGSANTPDKATNSTSIVTGEITVAGATVFELQHRCTVTVANIGFGLAAGFGVVEAYSEVMIWRVG